VQKTSEIFEYEERANLTINDTASAAMLKIASAETAEELSQWSRWAREQLAAAPRPIKNDFRFSDLLLQQWVPRVSTILR